MRIRKETLKLAAGSGGAAYRIRTYDPRITNAMLYVCASLSCYYKLLFYDVILEFSIWKLLRNLL